MVKKQEPYENVIFDVEEQHQGAIMEQMGYRKGELTNMEVDGKGRIRIEAVVPSRGLIGFVQEVFDHHLGHRYHDLWHYALWSGESRWSCQASKWCTDLNGQRYGAWLCTI